MSYPTKTKGTKVRLKLGNGATPEVFTVVCGITTKGLQRTRATNDETDWDCDDPDAAPVTVRDVGAGDWTMSGSGVANTANLTDIEAAYETPANWQLEFLDADNAVIRTYTGNAIMTDLTLGAANGSFMTISLTLSGNGDLTRAIL
jgi:hypothetical protein